MVHQGFYPFVFSGAFVALLLSLVPIRATSIITRGIVALISGDVAVLIGRGALFLSGMGAFGGSAQSRDLGLLTAMWLGVGYFVYGGVCLWLPTSYQLRKSMMWLHYLLMPMLATVSAFSDRSPELIAGLIFSLFLGICYALLWVRINDTREQHQTV